MKPLNTPIRDWAGRRVWLIGASSGIGEALARRLAGQGAQLLLSARGEERLARVAADCGAQELPFDLSDCAALPQVVVRAEAMLGGLDVVVFNAGTYRPVRAWQLDGGTIDGMLDINLRGVMHGVAAVLPGLLAQRSGALVLVGSVAGYGGLPRALVYGPGKAALINFAEALYLDLAPRGLSVFLVSPGFVETPLTAGNDFHMPALIGADEAAREILNGLARGAFEIDFPRRFTRVLHVLRWLPRRLYFALIRRATGCDDER